VWLLLQTEMFGPPLRARRRSSTEFDQRNPYHPPTMISSHASDTHPSAFSASKSTQQRPVTADWNPLVCVAYCSNNSCMCWVLYLYQMNASARRPVSAQRARSVSPRPPSSHGARRLSSSRHPGSARPCAPNAPDELESLRQELLSARLAHAHTLDLNGALELECERLRSARLQSDLQVAKLKLEYVNSYCTFGA
jgi:hypothetical protein